MTPSAAPQLDCDFYSITDLRQLIGIGRDEAYRIATEEMRHIRVGNQYRIPKSEYQAWIQRRLQAQHGQVPQNLTFTAQKGVRQRKER